MPRHPRLLIPGAIYHVYCRVARGEFVFDDDFDSDDYVRQVLAYVHLKPVAAGIVDDAAEFPYSGHREIIGASRPHVVDRRAVLRAFGKSNPGGPADGYSRWVRSVAETRWAKGEISDLPWWTQANHIDEIADADRDTEAITFDGQRLAEERVDLELDELALRFEQVSGFSPDDLASRFRSSEPTGGRIVLSTLAVSRYGFRVCDIAALIGKHGNSVTKWLTEGLRKEGVDQEFKSQIDGLDAAISRSG